uniref:RNA-dependent RNA polymerase n=1 Tax=Soybean thrips sobemo-like virus 3 TaxID=2796567 RepID=A0A7T3UYZ3_9VIRU|nr:RNA-dependent RNA polymerase [Soybean thrips sobemo-like virus 3]
METHCALSEIRAGVERCSCSDTIKLFVKDEPHSERKIAENRFRLIHCLSMEDQVIDRLLFAPWFGVELRDPMSVTQKAGWAPLPEGYRQLTAAFPTDMSVAIDKTAWDWTMPSWVVRAYLMAKYNQCVDKDPEYWNLVFWRFQHIVGPNAIMQLPEGACFSQDSWGLMKSGWLLTLSLNSASQAFQHALAWRRIGRTDPVPYIWAMGDDLLIRSAMKGEFDYYLEALGKTGCIVKKLEFSREFSGFLFTDNHVEPLYPDKHKFILKHASDSTVGEILLSYQLIYALSGNKWFMPWIQHARENLGFRAKLWAEGQIRLSCYTELPSWVEY